MFQRAPGSPLTSGGACSDAGRKQGASALSFLGSDAFSGLKSPLHFLLLPIIYFATEILQEK